MKKKEPLQDDKSWIFEDRRAATGDDHRSIRTGRIERRGAEETGKRKKKWNLSFSMPQIPQKLKKPDPKPARGTGQAHVAPKPKRHWIGWVIVILLVCLTVAVAAAAISVLYNTRHDYLWLDLAQVPYRGETILYYTDAQSGEVLEYATLPSTQNKEYVEAQRIPQQLKDAFVAVEDKNFYEHNGVSLSRTAYAALNEVKYWLTGSYIGGDSGRRQGASTIDQQLIKNLTRDDDTSDMAGYMRKLREIYRAYRMDSDYEKDEILCAYLNTISFTGNTAGVQAEAQKLFGKDVEELTLAECASLAAITRNPSRFNPVTNPQTHIERRNYVLSEMYEQGYIVEAAYQQAIQAPLELAEDTSEPRWEQPYTSYFTDVVMDAVVSDLQRELGISRAQASDLLYNGGLRIYTTVVPQLQSSMERTLEGGDLYPYQSQTVYGALTDDDGNAILDESGNPVYGDITVQPQAAMISLNYEGGICGVVGGLGEKIVSRGFNRATMAVRQVGSTMKPIGPYVLALEKDKITWSSTFYDGPTEQVEDEETGAVTDWPANATNYYSEKEVLVKDAFAQSINTVAVRVGETVGNRAIYNFVHGKLGVSTMTRADIDTGPMVLGSSTYGITPLELAKSYMMFGNGGKVYETYCYTKVTGGTGRTYLKNEKESTQAIGSDTAYIMNRLLSEVMQGSGTASGMRVRDGMDSVGKTGTTSDHRDHWFVGLTPYYVTASWYGYDENLPLGVSSHWNPPILAWRTVMEQAQQNLAYAEFPADNSVVTRQYCTTSGALAGASCPSATGYYKEDELPAARCPVHG